MMGAVLSTRVTLKEQLVELPARSVAVMVTTVTPAPFNIVPAIGDCVFIIDPTGVQSSVALADPR